MDKTEIPQEFTAAWENEDGDTFTPTIDEKLDYIAIKCRNIADGVNSIEFTVKLFPIGCLLVLYFLVRGIKE